MYLMGVPKLAVTWGALGYLAAMSYAVYLMMTIRFHNAVNEKTMRLSSPSEDVRETIPMVVSEKRWRMVQADSLTGSYEVKIGMTFQTWGQTMSVRVSKIEEMLTQIDVRCEAIGLSRDLGRNDAIIQEFYASLENKLRGQVGQK